jgi:hypothetical protein
MGYKDERPRGQFNMDSTIDGLLNSLKPQAPRPSHSPLPNRPQPGSPMPQPQREPAGVGGRGGDQGEVRRQPEARDRRYSDGRDRVFGNPYDNPNKITPEDLQRKFGIDNPDDRGQINIPAFLESLRLPEGARRKI